MNPYFSNEIAMNRGKEIFPCLPDQSVLILREKNCVKLSDTNFTPKKMINNLIGISF